MSGSEHQRVKSVTVVIVTYKSAELTIQSLQSVEAERTFPALNINAIVVDNASGDESTISEAVRSNGWDDWVVCVSAPINGGFAYGNNIGIRTAFSRSSPDYIYMLNPDAQIRPGAIRTLVEFLDAHTDVGIAGGSFENFDGSDWPFAFKFHSLLGELNARLELGVVTRLLRPWIVPQTMTKVTQPIDWVCGAAMMVRPAVFAAIGGLDERYFLYFEETDFCFRAKRAGFQTWYVPASRVMHISGQSTKVDERNASPKRLPPYWFESRRRFYLVSYGVRHAMLIDVVAIVAHALGLVKRALQLRLHGAIPHFLRDLSHHTVLRISNRRSLPALTSLQSRISP